MLYLSNASLINNPASIVPKKCNSTQVNEVNVVRGQIVILLSKYSTGIKNHFGTKII